MNSLNYGFILKLDIYNAVVVFSLGGDKEGIVSLVRENTKEGAGIAEFLEEELQNLNQTNFQGQCSYYDDPELFLVWMKTFDPEDSGDWAALVHELFHLTIDLMDSREAKLDSDNHEPHAYLNGYLFKAVKEAINRAIKMKEDECRRNQTEDGKWISIDTSENATELGKS